MGKYRILSIGFQFPGGEVDSAGFQSDQSLLDADIVVFEPSLRVFYGSRTYQGKRLLSENSSFRAKEALSHWRSELKAAFDAGKIIFIFLRKPDECYAYTGEQQVSGTGRSQKVTSFVSLVTSYSAIPLDLATRAARGTRMRPTSDISYLATYWKEFSGVSHYEVCIEGRFSDVLLTTKDGNRTLGAAVRGKRGAMIFLPPVDYDEERFIGYDEEKDIEYWTPEAQQFGKRLVSALVGIADAIKSASAVTPAPEWTQRSEFRLKQENELQRLILAKSEEIQALQSEKHEMEQALEKAGSLRRLLYESGTQLEEAVLEALRLLGFSAEPYEDAESEFDAVFVSPQGRFLGEAEGTINRAINIDKLSQLERNVREDFAREEVEDYAKGVLFGNPQRLTPVEERTETFTEKCVKGALRSTTALVLTCDLFIPARYLKENDDSAYAKSCREAIAQAEGEIVAFPPPPSKTSGASIMHEEESGSERAD